MKKQLLLAIVLLGAFGIVNADAPKAKGLYLGASAGNVELDDDGASAGALEDSDTIVSAFIGYKFFQYMSLEARYSNFGTYSDSVDTVDVTGISVNVVGMFPLGASGWEVYGQVGLAQMGVDINVQGVEDLEDNATTAGIGVRWHITRNIAIGAVVDGYVWTNDVIGSQFDLSVVTQQLTFQINF